MTDLVPKPILDIRSEERIAAQAIARVSGALTVELCDQYIATMQAAKEMLLAGTSPTPASCPELTNANVSAPQTKLILAFAWLVTLVTRSLNQVPVQNVIEFARFFGIELREATSATTTLRFTVQAPANTPVLIPAGTEVSTEGGSYVFTTDEDLTIPANVMTGSVAATRTVTGYTLLAPATLTKMVDSILYVTAVVNMAAIESGTDAETIDSAMERARGFQLHGEHAVTADDLQYLVFQNVLQGNGVVKVFPFIKNGDWTTLVAGYTTIIVMTTSGDAFADDVKAEMNALIDQQALAGQFVSLSNPQFVSFNVLANLKLKGLVTQTATLNAVDQNLQSFYAAKDGNFGRTISQAEIIAVIEGTDGVDRIVPQPDGSILGSPTADIELAPYQLPKLEQIFLNVV